MTTVQSKICGIKTPEALKAAIENGARFIGFVFFPPSPRFIEVDIAKELSLMLPTGVRSVALFVNPTDTQLDAVLGKVPIDMIQLHGDETPERVREIKEKHALPIIKAFPVRIADDIEKSNTYTDADWYLFDTKAPEGSEIPGGTGQSFDWNLLQGKSFDKPWMLSGGLNSQNIKHALSTLSPDAVDISSGVENSRGVKDKNKIIEFLKLVKSN